MAHPQNRGERRRINQLRRSRNLHIAQRWHTDYLSRGVRNGKTSPLAGYRNFGRSIREEWWEWTSRYLEALELATSIDRGFSVAEHGRSRCHAIDDPEVHAESSRTGDGSLRVSVPQWGSH